MSVLCVRGMAVMVAAFTASAALGQSGAALMLKPWKQGQAVEAGGMAIIEGSARTRDAAELGVQIWRFEAAGRARFDKNDEHSPAVGVDALQIDIHSGHPGLPERLADQAFGIGFGLAKWDNWEVGAVVGAGYAGDAPYNDSDAVYAHGDLIASLKVDDNTSWTFTLNYNGNRTFLPDLPIPGVTYNRKVSDTLRYSVGVPFTSVTWKPLENLTIDASYLMPYTVNVTATYELAGGFDVFAGFYNRYDAFHVDAHRDRDRIFFQQRLVEGGVKYEPCPAFNVTVAGGLAFGQEFSFGWDSRDTHDTIEVSSAPYVRFAVELGF